MARAKALHVKSQQLCILGVLQRCISDGIVSAAMTFPFARDSYCGVQGFQVDEARANEFKSTLLQVFPSDIQRNSINNAFRRMGFGPQPSKKGGTQIWAEAWAGKRPMVFKGHASVSRV